ncbi:MAG: hypothetical protein A2599_02225 [Candidatus Staskawiczbacteria bacterium RIFOXYD1_FULL_39_28]|uniref:Phosphoesterase n=1 Tax=Candidatus Staskawiczbacteria bacterium RIFOXYC1_FULL_38_18 TaxID=1802229 RepID=A0A1G2JE64_9BACT|nr:MAG: hypothetical protein A2401_03240 [Candidatus Staskawiczbacteria bacterium RIFOXYC1_FULL_38_18]OGZ91884.1 MAG: hypothetical protein A2599_02225 [Candidatus Staskawiczbacteria bacterium RIFOXYD1_FULL_39_28]
MKLAIISDTHDNLKNFEKAINWFNKEGIELVLHCGDISSQETIDFANKLFKGEIKYVKGNADFNLDLPDKDEMELKLESPLASSGRSSTKIAFTHFPDIAKKMAQSGKYDAVFYGHTHRPWDEKVGGCHMINPGEMAGQFYKPTFAVYDTTTENLELKILERL